jgi:hypothetical protein
MNSNETTKLPQVVGSELNDGLCTNPHWIGDNPAWDIILSSGEIHRDVTMQDISRVLVRMHNADLIGNGEQYMCSVVRKSHITNYNKWFTVHNATLTSPPGDELKRSEEI